MIRRQVSPQDGQAEANLTMQVLTENARAAQQAWALTPVRTRLRVIRALRHEVASGAEALAATVPLRLPGSLHRTTADTLVAEVLPLLEACRFLEREAAFLLAPRRESTSSRPLWLRGVSLETRRDPLGLVLVIGPGNYPLFLPGVQVLQALVAGNAVLWKPAPGGANAALAIQRMLVACGLEPALLTILPTSPESAKSAIEAGVDKVILTGSPATGRAVLHQLADTLTPSVMELSGCDAVFVLNGADLPRTAEAIAFALRLNGSATCMAPRRLFVAEAVANRFVAALKLALESQETIQVPENTRMLLEDCIAEATLYGAKILLNGMDHREKHEGTVGPTLVSGVEPQMRLAQTDIFAPVLSIMRTGRLEKVRRDDPRAQEELLLAAYHPCPYALTASIFGPPSHAESLATRLRAGTVLINDIIIPTADPRATFGGRRQSGFGTTRGREGLLAMTAPKTILRQASRSRRAYQPTSSALTPLFAGLAQALHARSWRGRIEGAKKLAAAAKHIK
jgi:aldehyde dehydrogenase (NAD+)